MDKSRKEKIKEYLRSLDALNSGLENCNRKEAKDKVYANKWLFDGIAEEFQSWVKLWLKNKVAKEEERSIRELSAEVLKRYEPIFSKLGGVDAIVNTSKNNIENAISGLTEKKAPQKEAKKFPEQLFSFLKESRILDAEPCRIGVEFRGVETANSILVKDFFLSKKGEFKLEDASASAGGARYYLKGRGIACGSFSVDEDTIWGAKGLQNVFLRFSRDYGAVFADVLSRLGEIKKGCSFHFYLGKEAAFEKLSYSAFLKFLEVFQKQNILKKSPEFLSVDVQLLTNMSWEKEGELLVYIYGKKVPITHTPQVSREDCFVFEVKENNKERFSSHLYGYTQGLLGLGKGEYQPRTDPKVKGVGGVRLRLNLGCGSNHKMVDCFEGILQNFNNKVANYRGMEKEPIEAGIALSVHFLL